MGDGCTAPGLRSFPFWKRTGTTRDGRPYQVENSLVAVAAEGEGAKAK